jgi:hypothetical protein
MPSIARAFIFLAIGAGLQAIIGFAVLPAIVGGTSTTTLVLASIGTIWAAAYGFVTGLKNVYAIDTSWAPRSIFLFIVDTTWSAINTITGHFFMIYCAVNGSFANPDERSQKSGMIYFTGAALPGAGATTIGNVMGGSWMTHELVHAQQARIFGPFYWFTYLLGYVANLGPMFIKWLATGAYKVPYEGNASICFVHWEAYGRVVMEDWAYHAAPDETIRVGQWVLWLFIALINVAGVVLIFGAIASLGVIAGLIGGAVLLVYAIIRAFFAKAH